MIIAREIWDRVVGRRFEHIQFDLSTLQVFVLQGELTLALKHPDNHGPSRQIALGLLDLVEDALVDRGVFTRGELAEIHKLDGVEV